jgi:dTDP-4-amino-4,6-dideoxygalactose transaminase
MDNWIKLSLPHLSGSEQKYVADAIQSTWIVPLGPYVDEFERRLEAYLGCENVVALSAGTAAIHLALVAAGVKAGDEVICQSMTFAASANPIVYIGAKPIFVDSEPQSWNINPDLLREAIIDRHHVTGRYPAAIIAVDLYGMPMQYDRVVAVANEFGIPLIEDAAEAIGSEYDGRKSGTIGRFGALSFNGNKMITTSGGGALVCPDKATADRVKFLATQARENRPYYYHETIGYNYRLSNVSAAIGCAQMEVLADRVARRRAIHELYAQCFAGCDSVELQCNPAAHSSSNFWLSTLLLDPSAGVNPEQLRQALAERKIETRRLWRPMHMQPVFEDAPSYIDGTSESLFDRGLCLPSSTTLSDEQIKYVATQILDLIK